MLSVQEQQHQKQISLPADQSLATASSPQPKPNEAQMSTTSKEDLIRTLIKEFCGQHFSFSLSLRIFASVNVLADNNDVLSCHINDKLLAEEFGGVKKTDGACDQHASPKQQQQPEVATATTATSSFDVVDEQQASSTTPAVDDEKQNATAGKMATGERKLEGASRQEPQVDSSELSSESARPPIQVSRWVKFELFGEHIFWSNHRHHVA